METKINPKFQSRTKKNIAILLAGLLLFAVVGTAVAQVDKTDVEKGKVTNPTPKYLIDLTDLGELLTRAIAWMLYIAAAIAVIFLIVGGFRYITAHGNEQAAEAAKKTMRSAVWGLVIIIMAFAIVTIINNLIIKSPDDVVFASPLTGAYKYTTSLFT